jgi:S-adenosylmethionine:tRNA ribosyltransferase-isomerase
MSLLDKYDYHLPPELIAHSPTSPRDAARLFVYDTKAGEIAFDTFANISRYLPKPSLLVFNDTKVVPARLWLRKESGGKIQVLLSMNEFRRGDALIKGIVDRKILLGAKLYFHTNDYLLVERQEEQFFFFRPHITNGTIWSLLDSEGVTPIPPYIKVDKNNETLDEVTLRTEYQSVLARFPASVAAPTASLHFTDALLTKLGAENMSHTEVTLHVGAGTFAPIDETNFQNKKLFTELYDVSGVSAHTIADAKEKNIPVIPVGTTALRTLESVARNHDGKVVEENGPTDIFIFPPYRFQVTDALITNFHVPRSSLMLLVDAFLEHKQAKRRILDLYDIAIKENFRFYSFGDGMLIL